MSAGTRAHDGTTAAGAMVVRAAVLTGSGTGLEIRDVIVPAPGPGQVRVRIAAAGVCHSDLGFVSGHVSADLPVVLGHEASGVVVDVGEGVTTPPGTRVVLNWAPACRSCWFCEHDQPWLCREVEKIGAGVHRGATLDGQPASSALGLGAFAEQVVVPEACIVPIPEGLSLELAAVVGCGVLTGVGAVLRTAAVSPGESVAVLGLGGVGLSAIAGARLAGATTIIAVDRVPEKEALARKVGATHFVDAAGKVAKEVRALTEGRGADHVLECVGLSSTIRTAWEATRRGGRTVVVGVGSHEDKVTFSPLELFHFARTLTSSVYGSMDPAVDIPELCRRIEDGELTLDPLVTHRARLDDLPEAFDRMTRGEGARTVVVMYDQLPATARNR